MLKEDFNKILAKMDELIQQCEECKISSPAEFNSLTVTELRTYIEKAKEAKSNMDKVLQIELYHIIGMGNLSAAQEVQLCAKIKAYTTYRPFIQSVCMYSLPATPTIPAKTDYNCRVLRINLNKIIQKN